MKTNIKERIVVIGAGFAGLNFIKKVDKSKYDVILVDKHNFHSFPPLFYQVASSGLEPSSILFPLRREVSRRKARGVDYRMGKVNGIDLQQRTISTDLETISYDRLVIAAGTTNNFFGNSSLQDSVYTMKSVPQAIRCRNDILDLLERASLQSDPVERRKLLNFVVVGGGPTGVEIAGALGEMKRYIIKREYPSIDMNDVTITILEGQDRVLGAMSADSSRRAERYLHDLYVNIRTGTLLKDYVDDTITLSDGSTIEASMVIWTAGVVGESIPCTTTPLPIGHGGRINVDELNRVTGLENVYALGDICIMSGDPAYPKGHPQLAQPAIQQAANLARNLNEGTQKPFRYHDKGSMATVGRNRAVVELKKWHYGGLMAWLSWMFIHLITLLGMRNKVAVLVDWLWAYFTYSTSLRLLLHPSRYPKRYHSYD